MTTIAYRDGIMAADSRICQGSAILGDVKKCWAHEGKIYAVSGTFPKLLAVQQYIESGGRDGAEALPITDGDDGSEACVIMAETSGIFIYEAVLRRPGGGVSVSWAPLDAPFHAVGSGAAYAIGAMAQGATAEEAVAIACRFDIYSGGRIRTLRLAEA